MSEITLLPCPACHECEDLTVLRAATDDDLHVKQISCPCGTFGPYRYTVKEAIEAWNSLPRHLTWTTEPPKVPGWYWFDEEKIEDDLRYYNGKKICGFSGDDCEEYCDIFRLSPLRHKFAGPIPLPMVRG